MKIAIAAREPRFEAEVNPAFGGAAYFVVVGTDGEDAEIQPRLPKGLG